MSKRIRLRSFVQRLGKVVVGSLFFMLLKAGLTAALLSWTPTPAWLAYLLVTVSISLLGWLYHSKISFRQPLTRQTLGRYISQAIILKIVDYLLFNLLFYVAGVPAVIAIVITSGLVFVLRLIAYWKYVFNSPPKGDILLSPEI